MESQAFERFPALAVWMERFANARIEGLSLLEWGDFCAAVNDVANALRNPRAIPADGARPGPRGRPRSRHRDHLNHVEETMSFVPCKAADLREGDRVRVALEGRVLEVRAKGAVCVDFDGSPLISTEIDMFTLNAGKLEREERPLQVGDRAQAAVSGSYGEILAIHDDLAWFKYDGAGPKSVPLDNLERVS
jgi:hypothetical protein